MKPQSQLGHAAKINVPFDGLVLGAVVQELRPQLLGGHIQDVRQPERTLLQLSIHTQTGALLLNICIDARFARVHLTDRKAAKSPDPSPFDSALRRLLGGQVTAIRQIGLDRLFELRVRSQAGEDSYREYRLIAELMGKHSNIVLLDENDTIVESAVRVTHRINRVRETRPGLKYTLPPGAAQNVDPEIRTLAVRIANDSKSGSLEELTVAIRDEAPFVSPFLGFEIALRCTMRADDVVPYRTRFGDDPFPVGSHGLQEKLTRVFEMLFVTHRLFPVVIRSSSGAGAYPIPLLQACCEDQEFTHSLNVAVDTGYLRALRAYERRQLFEKLRSEIHRELSHLDRVRTSLDRSIHEGLRAELYARSGELLLANLWKVEPGATEVTVTDYYDASQSERTISINPELSAHENAERCFERARRTRQGVVVARSRMNTTQGAVASLMQVLDGLSPDSPLTKDELVELRTSLISQSLLKEIRPQAPVADSPFQGHRIRTETTPEGYEILVGESATANDFLTTRLAHTNDLWLHVRAAASGHVVIRTNGKPDKVPDAVLERAARIAARHSIQKHSSLVAVDYTLKKYVRKPRGSKPGSVIIEREKTLHVEP